MVLYVIFYVIYFCFILCIIHYTLYITCHIFCFMTDQGSINPKSVAGRRCRAGRCYFGEPLRPDRDRSSGVSSRCNQRSVLLHTISPFHRFDVKPRNRFGLPPPPRIILVGGGSPLKAPDGLGDLGPVCVRRKMALA